ncbi:MAG: mexF [Panacagrimonas sp.]|jgi:multidrug efflux pump subunit AcrB|nr:mexF [Panacagrimonas sp.]
MGLGTIGGFRLQIQDRAGLGFEELFRQTQGLIAKGRQAPELSGLFSGYEVSVPQVDADVDREKAELQGVPVQDVIDTLQIYLGSLYVNDFNLFGRTYQVNAQADRAFRMQPEDILQLKTRNATGDMIPLGAFVNTAVLVFPLVVLLVFLVLAVQYESLRLPLAVILIMPMVLLSALIGVHVTGGDNNIFTQIGLIVLVGLASKNAILIVEFAAERQRLGDRPLRAVLTAARLRLRPILMTSLAFIMGVVPLVLASGAGAEMRHATGVAVFAGMIGLTIFGLLLTPLFFLILRRSKASAGRARRHRRTSRPPELTAMRKRALICHLMAPITARRTWPPRWGFRRSSHMATIRAWRPIPF